MTIIVLIKIMHVMHLKIEATREAMDWVRQQLRQQRDRARIRGEEQRRLGVWLETAALKKFSKVVVLMEKTHMSTTDLPTSAA